MRKLLILLSILLIPINFAAAGPFDFNFEQITTKAAEYTVAVEIKIEISMGTQSTEAQNRGIGAVVSPDGLVIFDGTPLDTDGPFAMAAGFTISAVPKSIEITYMDGTKYSAEFIGIDRFTKLGFCRIQSDGTRVFKHVVFKERTDFKIGEWVSLFMLMPEFVAPPLAADIGMISARTNLPENFYLTVGFNEMQLGSVLFDTKGEAIGVLGPLDNPATAGFDVSLNLSAMTQAEQGIPLLGIIGVDKLKKLIGNPPSRGNASRGWLGIYLQALTSEIADFWSLQVPGGIIINEVAKDSPADSAGLKTGDIIVGLNGMKIDVNKEENLPLFQRQISELGIGARAEFEVLRRVDGRADTLNLTATLTKAPLTPGEAPDFEDTNFEMTVREMVFADYNLYNLNRREFKGVVVKEVEPGGWAAVAEITPGDIIQAIGGQETKSVDEARLVLSALASQKPKEVVFFIWRGNRTTFINVKTDW